MQGVACTLACLDNEKKMSYRINPIPESHFEDCSSEESDKCLDSDSDEASYKSKLSAVPLPPPGLSVSYSIAYCFCKLFFVSVLLVFFFVVVFFPFFPFDI